MTAGIFLVALLAPLAVAQAKSFSPTLTVNPGAGPETYQVGASPNLNIVVEQGANPALNQDFQSIKLTLPVGLYPGIGGGQYCGLQKAGDDYSCANPGAKVGSATFDVIINGAFPAELPATSYLESPGPGQVAKVVTIPDPPYNQVVLESSGGLTTDAKRVVMDLRPLPTELEGNAIHIHRVDLTFDGVDGSGKPLTVNPAYCGANSLEATITSWGDDGLPGNDDQQVQQSQPHQFTGCEAVQYRPQMTMSLSNSQAGATSTPFVDLQVPQQDAATRKVLVSLPSKFLLNPENRLKQCSQAQMDSATCPAESMMGKVVTQSPLFAQPLTGSFYLGPAAGPDLKLALFFDALAGVRLDGLLQQRADGGLDMRFDEFPPLGAADMSIELANSAAGVFRNPFSCGVYHGGASLTSYTGLTSTFDFPLTVDGCVTTLARPKLDFKAELSPGKGGGYADLRLAFTQDRPAPITSVTVDLPKGLKVDTEKLARAGAVTAAFWDRQYRVGSSTLRPPKKAKGKGGVTMRVKKKELAGLKLRVVKKKSGDQLLISGIPQGRDLTDFTLRVLSRQIKAIRLPKGCTELQFNAAVSQSGYGTDGVSSVVKPECKK